MPAHFIRLIFFYLAREIHAYQQKAESASEQHALYVKSLEKSMSLLLTSSEDQAGERIPNPPVGGSVGGTVGSIPSATVHQDTSSPPTASVDARDPFEKDKHDISELLTEKSKQCDALQELVMEHTTGARQEGLRTHQHPGFHALEIINALHPCLEDIAHLGHELNDWIKRSTDANTDLYNGFKKIFHTVHTLKESKLERMFRQQHERVWKTLINRAMQIQTVLEGLYNPMLPGKGWFEDNVTHEVDVDPADIAAKINKLTVNSLKGYQQKVPWLYETDRALSAPRDPNFGDA
jgi:hypothetical protein